MDITFSEYLYLTNKIQKRDTPRCHLEMANWLENSEDEYHRILMGYRHIGKSSIMTPYIGWRLLRDPTFEALIVSASSTVAERNVRNMRIHLETHPLTQHLVSSNVLWKANEFTVSRPHGENASIKALVAGSALTGVHVADHGLVIADDLEIPKTCDTQGKREKLREVIEELTSVADRQLFIGTPHTESSGTIYNWLENELSYVCAKWPVWRKPPSEDDDFEGEPMWPERHNHDWIAKKKQLQHAGKFNSQYLLIPDKAYSTMFNIDRVIASVYDKKLEREEGMEDHLRDVNWTYWIDGDEIIDIQAYWDTARGDQDKSVVAVCARGASGIVYLVDVAILPIIDDINGMDPQFEMVLDCLARNNMRSITIESNYGPTFGIELKRYAKKRRKKIRINEYRRTANKIALISDTLGPLIQMSKLKIHTDVWETTTIKSELEDFPSTSSRTPDDIIDAMTGAILHLKSSKSGVGDRWLTDRPVRHDPTPTIINGNSDSRMTF